MILPSILRGYHDLIVNKRSRRKIQPFRIRNDSRPQLASQLENLIEIVFQSSYFFSMPLLRLNILQGLSCITEEIEEVMLHAYRPNTRLDHV